MIIIYLNKLYTTLYDIPKMMYKKENYDYHHHPLLLSQSLYHLYLSYNDVVEKKIGSSATGNRTRISVVTGRNTNHYTIAD